MSRLRSNSIRARRRRQQSLQAGTLILLLAGFVLVLVLVGLDRKRSEPLQSPPILSPDTVGVPAPRATPASHGDAEPKAR